MAYAGLLTIALTAALAQTSPGSDDIVLSIRKPIGFLLITPTGNIGSTSSSEIIRIVSTLFTEHTDLSLVQIDPAMTAECKGRLGCFVRRLSADQRGNPPELLLVLSNLTQQGAADRLSAVLVDVRRALALEEETHKTDEEWESELEARILESAVLAPPKLVALANEQETRAFLEQHFKSELRRAFTETGNWDPYGSIALATDRAGIAVELDGSALGITKAGTTRIARVPAGKHTLKLTHPKIAPFQTELIVERGATNELAPALETLTASPLSNALFWTGAGVAAAGTIVAAIAIARADSSVETLCVVRPGGSCETGRAFQTIGYSPSKAPTFGDEVNPSGVLLAPLGYSVAATGVVWSLSSVLFDTSERFPWIELAAGIVVGAATYGISAALDGDSFPR